MAEKFERHRQPWTAAEIQKLHDADYKYTATHCSFCRSPAIFSKGDYDPPGK